MTNRFQYLALFVAVVVFPLSLRSDCCEPEYGACHCSDYSLASVYLEAPARTCEIGFRGLCLQPTSSNLGYAAQAAMLPLPTPNWNIYEVRPEYHFGFDLFVERVLEERSSFVKMNWTHFNSKDSKSVWSEGSVMLGPFFEIGPNAQPYNYARGQVNFRFDSVNFDYGLFVNFGEDLHTSLFAGINMARIDQSRSFTYASLDGETSHTFGTPSTFLGAGPELGLDCSYHLCGGFSLEGGAAASLLVGTLKNHTTYDSFSPALSVLDITPPNRQRTSVDNRMQVVPTFGAKLGLAYSWSLENCVVKFECGYEARVCINALQSTDIGSEVPTAPTTPDTVGVYARSFQRNVSNFALSGPYLSLDIGF